MKRFLLICLMGVALSTTLLTEESSVNTLLSFEDITRVSQLKWKSFGNLDLSIENNTDKGSPLSHHVLLMKGTKKKSYYQGGINYYLGQDLIAFNGVSLILNPISSGGILRIEVYDDDNGNGRLERDAKHPNQLKADDLFVYNLNLDWTGWRVISIPFSEFTDFNPTVGDNQWNPYFVNGSKGAIMVQLILLNQERGNVPSLLLESFSLTNRTSQE